jgi:hypothetical protein
MNVIYIFSPFCKRIGNVFNQYLQNESPYMIAMVITYVGFRNDYKGQMRYSLLRIHRSQQQILPFVIYKFVRLC